MRPARMGLPKLQKGPGWEREWVWTTFLTSVTPVRPAAGNGSEYTIKSTSVCDCTVALLLHYSSTLFFLSFTSLIKHTGRWNAILFIFLAKENWLNELTSRQMFLLCWRKDLFWKNNFQSNNADSQRRMGKMRKESRELHVEKPQILLLCSADGWMFKD